MTNDPSDLPEDLLGRIPLFAELQRVLSWSGGPVNWDLARQIAVAAAASAESAHEISDADTAEVAEDARIAELWLTEATGFDAGPRGPVRAMTPARWAETACIAYRELVDPLATKVSSAMTEQAASALPQLDGELPGGMDPSMIGQALTQMAPLLLGVQTGTVVGSLAKDILGRHDLPLPSDDGDVTVIVPTVDAFAGEYGLDRRQARMWVTLHESAHRTVIEALEARGTFFALYHNYVASLRIDLSGALERMQGIDLSNPGNLEDAANAPGFFDVLDSEATSEALDRLDRFMALLEAVADRAVEAAAQDRLPDAARIAEAAARRRAGGDGTAALKQFLGIAVSDEARRAADAFTREVLATNGWTALARLGEDPSLFPTPDEIADPASWMRRIS